mmetsp:Transcript_4936/g.10248  ORF Transcript_4936/g.10248 Transcript_4936/m.10248 type:complete len:458 (-) Transcript_4936:86-1459(-)
MADGPESADSPLQPPVQELDEVDLELLEEVARLRLEDKERIAAQAEAARREREQHLLIDDDNAGLDDSVLQPGQEYYTGELLPNGVRHGKGTLVFANHFFRYTGDWENGIMQGQGTLFFGSSGTNFYEGQFLEGEITGSGIRHYPDGSSYNGEWVLGEKCGEGVMLEADGSKYEGMFQANRRHGTGTLTLPNGDVYLGEFFNNLQHGSGTFECTNGDTYDGEFAAGKFHGKGEAAWANGDTYTGEWARGMRHGKGIFTDGVSLIRYSGDWKDDSPLKIPARIYSKLPEPEDPPQGEDIADEESEEPPSDEEAAEPEPIVVTAFAGQPWNELLCIGILTAKPAIITGFNVSKALVHEESGRMLAILMDIETPAEGDLNSDEKGEGDKGEPPQTIRTLAHIRIEEGKGLIDPADHVPIEDSVFIPGATIAVRIEDVTNGLRPSERLKTVKLNVVLPKKK